MGASSYSECPTLPELPTDLIMQILLRVPVKSLVRFKLVSKTWHDILKTPYFISMHHKFNLGTVSLLLMCSSHITLIENSKFLYNHVFSSYSNDKSVRMLSPELQILADTDPHVQLLPGSCNGIVCYYDTLLPSIFLSNLATREFKRLPPTSFQQVIVQEWYQSAAVSGVDSAIYHQKWLQTGVAFGFDSANIYDFKVLRLFCRLTKKGMYKPSNKGLRAEMFTSSSNTWRQLHWCLDDSLVFLRRDGFFCANSFHFLADSAARDNDTSTIVCCNIRTERFKTMELPSIGNRPGSCRKLMVLKEFLSSVFTLINLMNCKENSLEIWIMKDYGVVESWTKLYKIGPPWGYSIPQCFWIEDDALFMWQWETGKLGSCHLNTLHVEDVKINGYKGHAQFVVYKETLVSIN